MRGHHRTVGTGCLEMLVDQLLVRLRDIANITF
jgi:hypothetical protein